MKEQPDTSRERETPETLSPGKESRGTVSPQTTPDGILPGGGIDRDIVFRYSRERRLARSPQLVRDLYDTSPASRPTLYKALTGGTRSGAMLLVSIAVVSFVLVFLSRNLKESGGARLAGNTVTVSAMSFPVREGEGETAAAYIAIVKKASSERAYTGPVDVAVSVFQQEGGDDLPITTRRIFFTLEPEEEFRFSVPFAGPELILVFRAEEELVALRIKPKQEG